MDLACKVTVPKRERPQIFSLIPENSTHTHYLAHANSNPVMKKLFNFGLGALAAAAIIASSFAFNSAPVEYEYQTMTVIESIIPAGLGRSRILIDEGGNMEEMKINNLYSAVGIKLENIYDNDIMVTAKLNEYSQQGWELQFVNTGVQSPTDGGKSGIYCTRYLLRRAK